MKTPIIGYVFAGLGVLGLLMSFEQPKKLFPFLQNISTTYILIAGVVLIALGVFFMIMAGGREKALKEVPIYKGKKIVGYRRH